MKRTKYLLPPLALALSLAGCSAPEGQMTGMVSDVQLQDGRVAAFTLDDGEKKKEFIVEADGYFFLEEESPERAAVLSGKAEVWAAYSRLQWPFGAQTADYARVERYYTGGVSLSDGTELEVWQDAFTICYQLPDGTVLLRESIPPTADHAYTSGEDVSDLPAPAQEKILAWYESRGKLYDIGQELESAWQDYRSAEDPADYSVHWAEQQVSPTASSERVIYILTTVTGRIGGFTGGEARTTAAFDRETGEHLDFAGLFACPADEALSRILDAAELPGADRQALEPVIRLEGMAVHEDHIEFSFPPGPVPGISPDSGYFFAVDLSRLPGLFRDWAAPVPAEGG